MTRTLGFASTFVLLLLAPEFSRADISVEYPIDISVDIEAYEDGLRIVGRVADYSGLPIEVLEQPVCVCWSPEGEPELLDPDAFYGAVTPAVFRRHEIVVTTPLHADDIEDAHRVFFGCGTPMWYGENCVEAQAWKFEVERKSGSLFAVGKATERAPLPEPEPEAASTPPLPLTALLAGCSLSYRGAIGSSLLLLALVFLATLVGLRRKRRA